MSDGEVEVLSADVLAWLRLVPLPRYHAVLADPPYGTAFMGKKWDTMTPAQYQAWVTEWATLMLDVVYPGAVLAMFGGTRTYHRLVCGLEDAGWEIYDCLTWMYGSGFPKSHDISKAIDREAGAERESVRPNPNHRPVSGVNYQGIYSGGNTGASDITAPATPDAERWQGYGTALKPAYEPVVLARAPRTDTYAKQALTYGTGALNIDGCRIAGETLTFQHTDKTSRSAGIKGNPSAARDGEVWANTAGRWPANVILDEHAAAALGAPSRFFYTAKAAAWEREAGLTAHGNDSARRNVHPTVKPIQLTEYLARLLLPPELDEPRRLLVPFAGVGSESIGARLAGWDTITGIEQDAEYVALARPRIAWWAQFSSYEQARAAYQGRTLTKF